MSRIGQGTRAGLLKAIALVVCLSISAFSARAQDQYVVVHVSPPVTDILPGSLYESVPGAPEFIFVPGGITIALIDENGRQYLVKGLAAVAASEAGLKPFEVDPADPDDRTLLERFLGFGDDQASIAAFRQIGRAIVAVSREQQLALRIDALGLFGRDSAYCMFSDTLFLERSTPGASEDVTFAGEGQVLTTRFNAIARESFLKGLRIEPGERKPVTVKRGAVEIAVLIQRLDPAILAMPPARAAFDLARRGCGLQAMTLLNSRQDRN